MLFLSKLFALKFRMYPLYIETFFISGVARLLIAGVPFRHLSRFLGTHLAQPLCEPTTQQCRQIDEVSLAISRIAKYTPWRCQCFEQGLTAKLMLRQRGLGSTLQFAVAFDSQTTLLAHAWLRCGSKVVTGGDSDDTFSIVGTFT